MNIELKQAAQDAAEAIDWLLKNIRLDAPQLSGKAMGNAEKCASALRTALAQQPVTLEPPTETFVQQVPDHCDRVLWRGRYLHLPMTRPENVAAKQDAAALNWIERQHLEELGMGLVIDAPNDGMYYVCGDSGTIHYGKTLREALASAIQQAEAKQPTTDTKLYTRPGPSLPDSIDPPTEDGTEYDYASGYTAGYAAGWNEYRDGIAWLLEAKP